MSSSKFVGIPSLMKRERAIENRIAMKIFIRNFRLHEKTMDKKQPQVSVKFIEQTWKTLSPEIQEDYRKLVKEGKEKKNLLVLILC
jgi:hypothetical protein